MAEYDLTAQLSRALTEYSEQVDEKVGKAVDVCTKGLRKDLRVTSPKLTGSYAKTWAIKKEKQFTRGRHKATVYNSKNYQRTHLLERDHAGPYGKGIVKGTAHIAPAEKKWTTEFVKLCEEACVE